MQVILLLLQENPHQDQNVADAQKMMLTVLHAPAAITCDFFCRCESVLSCRVVNVLAVVYPEQLERPLDIW